LIEAKSGEARTRALNYFRRAGAYLQQRHFDKAASDFGDGLALDAGNDSVICRARPPCAKCGHGGGSNS